MTKTIRLLGLMSGTSLDGLDIAHVEFNITGEHYTFQLIHSKTYELPVSIKHQLESIPNALAHSVFKLNQEIGSHYADCVNAFISEHRIEKNTLAAIASHGQTVFHQPHLGYTVQLGCGTTLAYRTGIQVINNFRALDIAAGGQGAPLVPIGDHLLFQGLAEGFLNIGGFANLSFVRDTKNVAYDIGPGNLPLNAYAQKLGFAYDDNGLLSKSGIINQALLTDLNNLAYYSLAAPKSLGTEWLMNSFYPLIPNDLDPHSVIATLCEHIAQRIAREINHYKLESIYVTGGGAHNTYLLDRIQNYTSCKWVIPNKEIIEFKEALIFAFLGLRYLEGKHNALASVTGAQKNVCGGSLHLPF